jgi:2,3-bisphosphoglycerate-independent phosphoglycerate mutase
MDNLETVDMEFVSELAVAGDTKMVLLVIDGLGGLADPSTGLTELQTADTPNLDVLARDGSCGLLLPIAPGITPGSGPAHLALFGYDPVACNIGRGALAATGVGIVLGPQDVAARVNFCTVEGGVVVDRRAGRIATEINATLCEKLNSIELPGGVTARIAPEKDYRAALVFSGPGLSPEISDTDPQRAGLAPLKCEPLDGSDDAEATARMVNLYVEKAGRVLAGDKPANMILTRGFARLPHLPPITELYRLRAAGIASYPMYRAVAQLVGMDVPDTVDAAMGKVETVRGLWDDYDYFYVHHKPTDSAGEDGDFARKVRAIEEADGAVASLMDLEPDVLVVTGDHSTPAIMKAHSWHPLPFALRSKWERRDTVAEFSEVACAQGALGTMRSRELMALMLANALRLEKFGA